MYYPLPISKPDAGTKTCERCDTEAETLNVYGRCPECEQYEDAHVCPSCSDEYDGNLIFVGLSDAKVRMLYCPQCASWELFQETEQFKELKKQGKTEEAQAHKDLGIEIGKRLLEEFEK